MAIRRSALADFQRAPIWEDHRVRGAGCVRRPCQKNGQVPARLHLRSEAVGTGGAAALSDQAAPDLS